KRNDQGLITGIKASFKTNHGKSGTYAVSGTEPIAPFEFFIQMNDQDVIQEAGFRTAKEKQAHSDRVMVRTGRLNKDDVMVTLMSDLHEEDVIDSEEKISELMEQVQKMKQQALEIKVMGKAVDAKTEKEKKEKKKVMKMTIDNLSYTDKDNNEFVFFGNDSLAKGGDRMKKAAVFINGTSFSGDTIIVDYKNIKDLDFDLVLPDAIAGSLGGIKAGKNGIFVINSLGDTDASERKIVIKKKGSWKGAAKEPLIIIDGKEQPKDKRLNDINPDDIESVSVLKGDAALKKYGDKGAHGVVEIILKK
ncbi:MAG: Plug domain-containing protein, partial [Flavobacteriia bacterium]|nr:Plug domain-containing protein [Flavobacteriia bacterium]